MTTIVYDHKAKQIAIDSRITRGHDIVTDEAEKWELIDGAYWFFAGTIADEGNLVSSLISGDEKSVDCSAIVVDGLGVYLITNDGERTLKSPINYNEAIGGGQDYAKAALDFNCSAKTAVKYVSTKHCMTGGKIHVFDVEQFKFIGN